MRRLTPVTDSARPLFALGMKADAVGRLERAVSLLPIAKGNYQRGARARLALADALWSSAAERPRARAMALEAAAKLKPGKDAEKLEAWLGKH